MLKEILEAFRHKDVVKELSIQVCEMLEAGKWMFEQASDVLMRKADWNTTCDSLYSRDRQIRANRRLLQEYLRGRAVLSWLVRLPQLR